MYPSIVDLHAVVGLLDWTVGLVCAAGASRIQRLGYLADSSG